jgi:ribonuclease P protein component
VKRRFRLTQSTDFQRVRRFGKSYAHPLMVLIALPNDLASSRIGVAAGRTLGKAVQRNRAKRLLRATVAPLLPAITPGWDILLIARLPILQASFGQIEAGLEVLLKRAKLLQEIHDV